MTRRNKQGWNGLDKREQQHFVGMGSLPNGVNRPVVRIARPRNNALTESLIFLEVVETFEAEDLNDYSGSISQGDLAKVTQEFEKRRNPRVANSPRRSVGNGKPSPISFRVLEVDVTC